MENTAIKNVNIFQEEEGFIRGSLHVSGDRISVVIPEPEENNEFSECTISLPGRFIIPGLVDIHTHGNSGYDFSDGSIKGLHEIGKYLAAHGVTSFAPTSMTLPYENLETAFRTVAEYTGNRPADEARVAGIHMEGPFLSEKKKGAQNGIYLKQPDPEAFFRLQEACGYAIRIVDVAPELAGAEEFIRSVSEDCRVSVGHTDASYEQAQMAFYAGASHVAHLFNAMPPVHHREPGVIGAAFENDKATVELICDGLHVHPNVIRMAFRLFAGRICLVSDALRCTGMPDGEYELGEQQIVLKNGQARLPDGKLAGAVSNLYEDMVLAMHFGIPAEEAILAATMIPAKVVGMEASIGSLEPGKKADFIICDKNWNLEQVYLGGVRIR